MTLSKQEKLKMCRGCRDDFYNDRNPFGIKECWCLKDAKIVTRYAIGYWTQMDTAKNFREVKVLHCYSEEGSSRTVCMTAIPQHLKAEWNRLEKERSAPTQTVDAVDPVVGVVTE